MISSTQIVVKTYMWSKWKFKYIHFTKNDFFLIENYLFQGLLEKKLKY